MLNKLWAIVVLISCSRYVFARVNAPQRISTGHQLPAGSLITSCVRKGTAALTFDDGPDIHTSELVDSLNAIGAKATFFVCGNLYGCLYDLDRTRVLEKAFYTGHQIASHTWSHPALDTLPPPRLNGEISKLEVALDKILGVRPRWIRPPYGRVNDTVRAKLREMDYKIALWDGDSEDWNRRTPEDSFRRLVSHAEGRSSFVALMHDPLETTSRVLGRRIAEWAMMRGFRLVTLSECLGEQQPAGAYERLGPPQLRDATWACRD